MSQHSNFWRRNACVVAVIEELGSIPYTIKQCKKSIKIRYGDKLQFTCVVGITPSDRRAAANARAHIRRTLREVA